VVSSPQISDLNFVCISPLYYWGYMPHSPYSPWFDHIYNVWLTVQIMKLFVMPLPPRSCYFFPLAPNILFNTVFLYTLNLYSSHNARDQVLRNVKCTQMYMVSHLHCSMSVVIFYFCNLECGTTCSHTEWSQFPSEVWKCSMLQTLWCQSCIANLVTACCHS
jgi:hypothetical protein